MSSTDKKIEVSEVQLKELLRQNQEYKKDIEVLKECSLQVMEILGCAENGKMKKEIIKGDESFIPGMLKGIGGITSLMFQAQVPVLGKAAEEKIKQKFSFLQSLLEVINKHENIGHETID